MGVGRKNNKLAPAAREWRVRKLAELSATSSRWLISKKLLDSGGAVETVPFQSDEKQKQVLRLPSLPSGCS